METSIAMEENGYVNELEAAKFPVLSRDIVQGSITSRFTLSHALDRGIGNNLNENGETINVLGTELISNISIVPFIGDQCVVMQIDNGNWELPGGTLEPGEHYLDALKRELMEELGAELVAYRIFGQFNCFSKAEGPYKPHIPHPRFVRLLVYGDVRLTAKPLNPEDGEQVIAVEAVDIDEAVSRYRSIGRNDIAEVYRLGDLLRKGATR